MCIFFTTVKNSTVQYHGSSHTFPMPMSVKCFVVGQIFNHTQLDSMAPSLLSQPTSPQAPPSPLRVGRPQTCQRLMKLLMLGWPSWCDRTHWVNLRENNGKPTGNHDLCSVKGFMQTLLSCSFSGAYHASGSWRVQPYKHITAKCITTRVWISITCISPTRSGVRNKYSSTIKETSRGCLIFIRGHLKILWQIKVIPHQYLQSNNFTLGVASRQFRCWVCCWSWNMLKTQRRCQLTTSPSFSGRVAIRLLAGFPPAKQGHLAKIMPTL